MIRKSLLAVVGLLLASTAFAQLGPQGSTYVTPAYKATYSAAIATLSPAASATDVFTIQGSATKTIRVISLGCTGTATAAESTLGVLIKRSAANTTGTSTTLTDVPHDSSSSAGTALVKAYTANPGALGAAVGNVKTILIGLTAPAALSLTADPGPTNMLVQPVTLRGLAQTLALNHNAASFGAGAVLTCSATWYEE